MGFPIWDGNGNDFKPMGIPTCGFCGFYVGLLEVCLISGTGRVKMPNLWDGTEKVPNSRDGMPFRSGN